MAGLLWRTESLMPKNFPESRVETPDENARRRRNSHVRFWKMGEATAMTEMRAQGRHSSSGKTIVYEPFRRTG
jgi:hypothetical protein